MKRKLLLAFFVVWGLFQIQAQDDVLKSKDKQVHQLSLEDAKNYAVEHNYQNQNSKIDIEIAKKQIWETTAIGLPQIEATGDYQNMVQIPTQLLPGDFFGQPGTYVPVKFGVQHSLTGALTATQLIFSGEYIVGLQASKIFLEASKQGYAKSTKLIKENITKSYYLALIAEESKNILEETNKNFDQLLSEIEESHRLGFVEDIDVDQLRLTKQNNDNMIISANSMIELTKRMLKYQLGISYQDSIVLRDSINTFTENLDFDEILFKEFNINKNIDYKLIQTQESFAMLNLRREKSTNLPQLAAFFTHSQNTMANELSDLGSDWYPTTIIGLQLKIPLFSTGMRRSRIQQKNLELKKAQNTRMEMEEGLRVQVEQSRSNFIDAKNTYQNLKQNMELAKKINDKTEIKYKKGMSSSNELMVVQNQYLNALNNYYLALNQLLDTRATLEYVLQED